MQEITSQIGLTDLEDLVQYENLFPSLWDSKQ